SIIDVADVEASLKNLFANPRHNLKLTKKSELKPIIKYAGGKRSIMNKIIPFFPDFNNYYEPFAGGLSVSFHLRNIKKINRHTKVFLSDINKELMSLYKTVAFRKRNLIKELDKKKYLSTTENFKIAKSRYNKLKKNSASRNNIELSALFLYLNKTGYNGLYRENQSGDYNVPYGKKENVKLYDSDNLENLSDFLCSENVSLDSDTFENFFEKHNPQQGDLVYLDPPYHKTFSGYNKTKFDENSQIHLKKVVDKLTQDGCKVITSNSDTEFIRELYQDYTIDTIEVKRVITSKTKNRSVVKTELLIKNF
ncbi:MAG: Dam family site-specific DNA-(adenine-N6)-methyltransferase, partial [Alphaproteobacteria bacterium]